ncbi:MAG: hypothetical protein HOE85_09445 [Nitrospinaceae bacterium]|jgi:putative DNA primase/helicase|nr:hypothetical protein [Nitrospinaceae bacterium]
MRAEEYAPYLDKFRRAGRGFTARCPAHDDGTPSLSLRDSDDGKKLLLHCHAGCTAQEIIEATGHTIKELFND